MNEKARRRVIRSFVASILTSDLTRSEIYEIADELSYGGLSKDLSDALRDVSMIAGDVPNDAYGGPPPRQPRMAEVAFETVQRRKMSKKTLLEAISVVAPRLTNRISPSGSVKQILEWYFESATPVQSARLLNALNETAQDPYLKGIVRRD